MFVLKRLKEYYSTQQKVLCFDLHKINIFAMHLRIDYLTQRFKAKLFKLDFFGRRELESYTHNLFICFLLLEVRRIEVHSESRLLDWFNNILGLLFDLVLPFPVIKD